MFHAIIDENLTR